MRPIKKFSPSNIKFPIKVTPLYRRLHTRATLISTRAAHGKKIITNLGLGNKTTCVYHLFTSESNYHSFVITQFFILNGLGPRVNFHSDLAHMIFG